MNKKVQELEHSLKLALKAIRCVVKKPKSHEAYRLCVLTLDSIEQKLDKELNIEICKNEKLK